jgi:TonB family protein
MNSPSHASPALRLLALAALGLAAAGCTTGLTENPAAVERIDAIMRTPARLETETAAQRARRELREKAFGQPIGLLAEKDAYEPPHLVRYVPPPAAEGPGEAEVAVMIDNTGRVTAVHLVSASSPALADPALATVRRWRFSPGKREGQLIAMSFIFPVEFRPR